MKKDTFNNEKHSFKQDQLLLVQLLGCHWFNAVDTDKLQACEWQTLLQNSISNLNDTKRSRLYLIKLHKQNTKLNKKALNILRFA